MSAPASPAALYAQAVAEFRQGRLQQALLVLGQLLQRVPSHADGWNLVGVIHGSRRQYAQAAQCHRRAIAAGAPNGTWVNLGLAEQRRQAWTEAEAAFREALRRDPALAIGWQKLAGLYEETGRPAEALECHRQALHLEPGNLRSLSDALLLRRYLADWGPDNGPQPAELVAAWRAAARSDASPLLLLALPEADALVQKAAAATFAHSQWGALLARPAMAAPATPVSGRRLRIGYLSSDFRAHAISFLVLEAIAAHDRDACEVVLYACDAGTGDAWRDRARAVADRFVELEVDDNQAAQQIAADRLDLLVDLNGYTAQARTGVVARRPAPVIASWLGYIGTLGDRRLADYVIGDAIATPEALAGCFSESLALLPHCFQANPRVPVLPPADRVASGLPRDGVVFCSFNQAYKLHPALWDDWCAVLARVPGSVLWLAPPRDRIACANLCREAAARGVDPQRIVFAGQLSRDAHLSRLALADIALDTWPYNSGTTASDALRMGVPLLTFAGDTFAGRMAASLLAALGQDECVLAGRGELVEQAVRLGNDGHTRARLRQRLAGLLPGARLFDPRAMAGDLERLYRAMHANAMAGRQTTIRLSG